MYYLELFSRRTETNKKEIEDEIDLCIPIAEASN